MATSSSGMMPTATRARPTCLLNIQITMAVRDKASPTMATNPEENISLRFCTSLMTRVMSRPTGLRWKKWVLRFMRWENSCMRRSSMAIWPTQASRPKRAHLDDEAQHHEAQEGRHQGPGARAWMPLARWWSMSRRVNSDGSTSSTAPSRHEHQQGHQSRPVGLAGSPPAAPGRVWRWGWSSTWSEWKKLRRKVQP